jgi:hypothetical protein
MKYTLDGHFIKLVEYELKNDGSFSMSLVLNKDDKEIRMAPLTVTQDFLDEVLSLTHSSPDDREADEKRIVLKIL